MKLVIKLVATGLLLLSLAACVGSRTPWNSDAPNTYKARLNFEIDFESLTRQNEVLWAKYVATNVVKQAAQLSSGPALFVNLEKRKKTSKGAEYAFSGSIAELGKRIYFYGKVVMQTHGGGVYFVTAENLKLARSEFHKGDYETFD